MEEAADKLYTPKSVRNVLNISVPIFASWVSRGFLRPSYPARGRGRGAQFTRLDILKAAIFKQLSEAGFSNGAASDIAHGALNPEELEAVNIYSVPIAPDITIEIDVQAIKDSLEEIVIA